MSVLAYVAIVISVLAIVISLASFVNAKSRQPRRLATPSHRVDPFDASDFEGSVDGTVWPGLLGVRFAPGEPTEVEAVKDSPLAKALKTGREFRLAFVGREASLYGEAAHGSRPQTVSDLLLILKRDAAALRRIRARPTFLGVTDHAWEKAKLDATLPHRGQAP